MTVQAAVGTISILSTDAVNTTKVISCGFQPKAIIFWCTGQGSATDAVTNQTARYALGVATGTADRRSVGSISTHAAATINGGRVLRADACLAVPLNTSAVDGLLDISAVDSDGFTVIVDDAFTVNLRISYLALGGDSITNAATGSFNCPTTTGNFDVTSLAFQPDFVLMFTNGFTSDPPTTSANRGFLTVGAAVSSTKRAVLALGEGPESNANSQSKSYAYDGEVLAVLGDTPTSINTRADFVSFLSNGFRLNFLQQESSFVYRVPFLAIKGGDWEVGNLLTQTDTVTAIAESGFGFQPAAALLVSHNLAKSTQNTVQAEGRLSIGAFTATDSRVAQAMLQEDGLANTDVTNAIEYDEAYINLSAASAVQGAMDVQSIDSDGFTLIMDDADPSQAFVWYFATGLPGASGNHYTLSAAPAAASATPAGEVQIARKLTRTGTAASATPAALFTTVHKLTASASAASNTAGGDLRIARKVTATGTAASATAGGDLRIARKLTRTGTAASNTAGGDLRIARKLTGTVNTASNTAGGDVRVARQVVGTVNAGSNAVGATLTVGFHWVFTAAPAAASNTASVGLTVLRKLTATSTAASNTAGGDLRVARKVTGTVNTASATAGGDLRIARKLTRAGTAASATATVALTVVHKLTGAVNAVSNTAGNTLAISFHYTFTAAPAAVSSTPSVGLTVVRKVTGTVNTVSLTAGGDLRVVRQVTYTVTVASVAGGDTLAVNTGFVLVAAPAAASNTPSVGLTVARQVTGAMNVASNAVGATLAVSSGFVFTAAPAAVSLTPSVGLTVVRQVTATSAAASVTAGGDLRILRKLTGGVNGASFTPAAALNTGEVSRAQMDCTSQTAVAVLVVEHRLTSHPAAFSAVGGTDLVRAWGLTVALTRESNTATATFERVWLFQAEAVTATPDLPLSLLRRPSALCLSASATVDSAALVLNRAMTGLVPVQSVTPAASLTRHLDLAFTADLASLSPLVDWVIGRPLSGFCAVETLTPDSEGFTVERLLTLFLACATATPSAHFLFAEQTMHGRARLHFSARAPVLAFRVRHG